MEIIEELFKMQDLEYKSFQSKLVPNVNFDTIIGVRIPLLRKLAKRIKNECKDFLCSLPHRYYDENNLHSLLISQIDDFDQCIALISDFLPFVDNWATCDMLRPKCFKNNKQELLEQIQAWISSSHTYTVRFAIEMLMVHYLDDDFHEIFLKAVSKITSDEYYINMMISWYFSTALAKQWESTVPYIEQRRLSSWVHNKTIQKSLESYRICEEHKEYLRKLKI